jgi:hypothetical protein
MNANDKVSSVGSLQQSPPKHRSWSDTLRDTIISVISCIIDDSKNIDGVMVPACGAISHAAKKFKVTKNVALRIWAQAIKNHNNQKVCAYQVLPKKGSHARRDATIQ